MNLKVQKDYQNLKGKLNNMSEKMSNGEHEIRTPKGLRIGNRSVVDGKNMLQIKRGGCEDYISAESLVECIHGLPVKSIEFFTAENQRKEA